MRGSSGHFLLLIAFVACLLNSVDAQQHADFIGPGIPLEGIEQEFVITSDQIDAVFLNDRELKIETNENRCIRLILHSGDILRFQHGQTILVEHKIRTIPLWLSILPPLIAIVLALVFKEVISALFAGLFVGTLIPGLFNDGFIGLFSSILPIIDHYVINALNDSGHLSVIVFSMLIGATVSLISKNGGMRGVVNGLSAYANNRRSGQLVTWFLGILIFFDDYANTLIVGNTMRPVTDRLRISREKLAYIVDSTAAPIAAIAFVTTWIGAELGYIQDGLTQMSGISESVYHIFLASLKYSFYPILALIFIAILIYMQRDFGPMIKAEEHASSGKGSKGPITDHSGEMKDFEPDEKTPSRWYNAGIPVFIIILGTIAGLLYTGWDEVIWNSEASLVNKLSDIIGQSDSYTALLWSSISGLLSAVVLSGTQRILNVAEMSSAIMSGFKAMLPAMIILVLAWSLSEITSDLHTADFLTGVFSGQISPFLFPGITFILAAIVAFSTGSSWGTMAILYPLLMPLSWTLCADAQTPEQEALEILYNTISCVLAGSVLGDHCSPISDTTILSSLASSCNHIEHVRTQLPYALTVGLVALFAGTIPSAFGVPSIVCMVISIGILILIIRKFGRDTSFEEELN